jgi:ATP/maltotriose-dependent transcriptional regulator MalT
MAGADERRVSDWAAVKFQGLQTMDPHITEPIGVSRIGEKDSPTWMHDVRLSPREHMVLQLISRGYSNKRVAQSLGIAPETVKSHAKHIFVKLRAQSRLEAVLRALILGLI